MGYFLGLGAGKARETALSLNPAGLGDPSQKGLFFEGPQRHKPITVRPARPNGVPCGSTISKSPSTRMLPLLLMVIFVEDISVSGPQAAAHPQMIAEEIGKREPPERESLRNHDFAQRAGGHIVGISAHLNLLGKKSILPDTQDLFSDALVDVAKSMKTQMRCIAPGFRRES